MQRFKQGDSCWIWKDGYLLHDYIELFNDRVILTKQIKAVRLHQEVFKNVSDGIEWMECALHTMKTYNPPIGVPL